jgi:hypothetical protein
MILRADHVSGAVFVAFGLLVIALSGDLPFGNLAMPGAGFLPRLISILLIVIGAILMARAGESRPLAAIAWSDARHAGLVLLVTAAAAALYEWLGFLTTMVLMLMALLVVIERRSPIHAAIFSVAVAAVTWFSFEYVLRTPLSQGPFGF